MTHVTTGAADLHGSLVEKLKTERKISTASVEAAFRAVPRHLFVPGVRPEEAYRDEVIFTKQEHGRSVSASTQPSAMALMLEQLALQPGQRVLEVGAGTGYNAALMAHIVGEAGQVTTIDIDRDLVEGARRNLSMAGLERVRVMQGDGSLGHADGAPYDRIIVTVGAADVLPAWREQLSNCGRLVMPITLRGGVQKSVALEQSDGCLRSVSVRDCRFVMLRGALAGQAGDVCLGPNPSPILSVEDPVRVNTDLVQRMLSSPSYNCATRVRITSGEFFTRLRLWLALREPDFFLLSAEGTLADNSVVPDVFHVPGKFSSTAGLLDRDAMCLLSRGPEPQKVATHALDPAPFDVWVRIYQGGECLGRRLISQVAAWDSAARPGKDVSICAFPSGTAYVPLPGEYVIPKYWSTLLLELK